MVYHNYCMRLFAACMIFNDLVIKKAKYPKAFFNFIFSQGYLNTAQLKWVIYQKKSRIFFFV